jgi:ABC-type enterochelin transport system permease subunit
MHVTKCLCLIGVFAHELLMSLISLFMYRFKRLQNLPEFFNGYFTQNNEVHHYNTRNANKFHVNFCRTNYAKHTIVNKGS